MTFKTSLFKKGLLVSDFKRYWWVSALYTLMLLFLLPVNHLLKGPPETDQPFSSFRYSLNPDSSAYNLQILLLCVVPVILAVLLFRYMQTGSASAMAHSLPCTRRTLFASHSLAGLILIVIPAVVTGLVLMLLNGVTFLKDYYTLTQILQWTGMTLILNVILFSFTVFVGMFTGSSVAAVAFSYILQLLPAGLYVLVEYNLRDLFYGYADSRLELGSLKCIPLLRLIQFDNNFSWIYPVYLVVSILLLIAAALVYRLRNLESAGDIIAFPKIRPLFKYGVAICGMLLGGTYFANSNPGNYAVILAGYLISSFFGYWIAEIVLQKSFRVWRAYKGYLVYTAITVCVFLAIAFDVTGYVHRIPKPEDVKNVYLGYDLGEWKRLESPKDQKPRDDTYVSGYLLEEPETIKNVVYLQKQVLKKPYDWNKGSTYIIYTLKNGKHIIRQYNYYAERFNAAFKPIFESMEYKEKIFPVLNQKLDDISVLYLRDSRVEKKQAVLSNKTEIKEFIEALRSDMLKMTYEQNLHSYGYLNIQLTGGNNKTLHEYNILNSYSNTIRWLKEKGYYETIILQPSDVTSATLEKIRTQNTENDLKKTNISLEIHDEKLIKELLELDYVYRFNTRNEIYSFSMRLKDSLGSNGFTGYINTDAQISDALRSYLKKLK